MSSSSRRWNPHGNIKRYTKSKAIATSNFFALGTQSLSPCSPRGERASGEIGGLKFEMGGWYPNK
jgi:hypothetical protein